MIQIFAIIHKKIIKIINETSVWEKKMLKCKTSNKNAIKSVQDTRNFAVSMTDKAASDSSSNPCLVLYPSLDTTDRPNIALLLIYLAIIKWISINCL